jgi:hypothetical protein
MVATMAKTVEAQDGPVQRKSARRAAFASVSCLAIFVITFFLQSTVFDSAGFMNTVSPLAGRPELQTLMAKQLSTILENSVAATPAGRVPGVLATLQPKIEAAAAQATSSPEFATQWIALEGSVHDQIIGRISSDASYPMTITENLTPLATSLLQQLRAQGLPGLPAQIPPSVSAITGPTLTAAQLATMHAVYSAVTYLEIVSGVLAILMFAFALMVSTSPLAELEGMGKRCAVQMAILCALIAAVAIEARSKLGTQDKLGQLAVVLFNSLNAQLVRILQLAGGVAVVTAVAALFLGGGLRLYHGVKTSRVPVSIGEMGKILRSAIFLVFASIILLIGTPYPATSVVLLGVTVGGVLFVFYAERILRTLQSRKTTPNVIPILAAAETPLS